MMSASKKLGVVTVNSTDTEIVADGERFPKNIWFGHFRLAQGDIAKEDMLMQDDESSTSLHKHHPFSMGKGRKHVSARFFFAACKMN